MKFSLFSLLCFSNHFRKRSRSSEHKFSASALPEGICREFSLSQIKAATNNFHKHLILGQCRHGPIYRGTVDDGNGTIDVAVKRFLRFGFENFRREIELLCQLRHPHVVPLIGFCNEGNEFILVCEHASKGSLSDHLFGKDYVALDWKQRLEICIGAARGLHYLHAGAKRVIIHRNIKCSNILLDDEWSPKISDFELSKIGPLSMSKALIRIESNVAGTFGYLDPEYATNRSISEKCDVYSFGVVLLEVLCGRYILSSGDEVERNLADWAHKCVENGTIYNIIDPHLKGRIAPDCFKQYVDITFDCLRVGGDERPSMGEVKTTLELALQLQNKANPLGECLYEDALFCAPHLSCGGNAMESDDNSTNN